MFPRADIRRMIAPDILHQVIKGGWKDHLVAWVERYLYLKHTRAKARAIMDEIDRRCAESLHYSMRSDQPDDRIALAAPFSGLRRFAEGRRFKQWTGDDSKALMKVSWLFLSSPGLSDAV